MSDTENSSRTTPTEASTVTPAATPRTSVIHEGLPTQLPDIDPDETQDWLESFDALVEGPRPRPGALPDAAPPRTGA